MDSTASGESSGRKYVDVSSMVPAAAVGSSSERPGDKESVSGEEAANGGGTSSSDGGSFDCNICLELAQDPVVTLCGHLFCWPCLYRWLHLHSILQECPVCKAGVEEEKVIPLYGRGKVGSVDPRTKAVPGVSIPQRPPGQRPETVRLSEQDFNPHGFNFMAGSAIPTASARFGNITLSAGFGLFPSLFGLQLHGFQGTGFTGAHGIHLGAGPGLAGSHIHAGPQVAADHSHDAFLSRMFLLLGIFVILCLLFF